MTALAEWPEIDTVLKNKRFELVLKKVDSSSRVPSINDDKLQEDAFPEGNMLNLLYIGECGLERLSSSIANCRNLTNLVLKNNKLRELPEEIGSLTLLKLMDVSSNELTSLPSSMTQLENLQSLDIAKNQLTNEGLFDFSGLAMLHILEASHNLISRFPPSLCSESLVKLHTVNLSSNKFEDLPIEFSSVRQLKDFKMESNNLTQLPLALALHERLKFLDLKSNPFDDRRFRKLANDPRSRVPSVLDYLRKKYMESEYAKEREDEEKEEREMNEDKDSDSLKITTHLPNLTVKTLSSVLPIRPHLLTCVIRNLDLSGQNFRKFINLQNKLHQGECSHRTVAAIGTHDLSCLKLPLRYLALPLDELFITALHKKTPVSARDLLANLLLDSELARKREKRSNVSAVHRYLHLVKDSPLLACLIDADGLVISLAPLTNSDLTKMNESTKDILVEVSSQESLQVCHSIMDNLITEIRVFSPSITLDQMRVLNEKGDLLGECPSRASLEGINKHLIKHE